MMRRFKHRRSPVSRSTYIYRPRGDLLQRLERETGLSPDQILKQLRKERIDVLRRLGHIIEDNELI